MATSDNSEVLPALPDVFCWTKFGVEAGEATQAIFVRKEVERLRNGGVFLWGIGSSIRPSLTELLRETANPEILFSPMKSAAAKRDIAPQDLVVWSEAVGYDGSPYRLPDYSLVTSRRDSKSPKSAHFALVCECETSISGGIDLKASVSLDELRNIRTGSTLGASQVTSVVRRIKGVEPEGPASEYPVRVRARLIYPYFVRLCDALPVPDALRLDQFQGEDFIGAAEELLRYRRSATGEKRGSEQLTLV